MHQCVGVKNPNFHWCVKRFLIKRIIEYDNVYDVSCNDFYIDSFRRSSMITDQDNSFSGGDKKIQRIQKNPTISLKVRQRPFNNARLSFLHTWHRLRIGREISRFSMMHVAMMHGTFGILFVLISTISTTQNKISSAVGNNDTTASTTNRDNYMLSVEVRVEPTTKTSPHPHHRYRRYAGGYKSKCFPEMRKRCRIFKVGAMEKEFCISYVKQVCYALDK